MDNNISEIVNSLPENMQRVRAARNPLKLEELFPGANNKERRAFIRDRGYYEDGNTKFGVYLNADGYVTAMAAVNRKPTRSFDYVKEIEDFKAATGTSRADKIALWYRIYKNEGMPNNAVNKSSALVSTDGSFYIKNAKKGKRPRSKVKDELAYALNWWKDHVNARPTQGPITGARGLTQIMEQGSRQALIEGSYIAVWHEGKMTVPSLGTDYLMPTFIQSISSQYIEIPRELVGTGLERFYWAPPREVINAISNPQDKLAKEIINQAYPSDFISQLKKNGKAELPYEQVLHIKHRGVEFEAFGESFIEPAVSDIKYKRALQGLEFVTIDSLVNRLVIVKVGSDKPDSDYHNIETAQERLKVLQGLYGDAGPNMHLLWAGPDIEVVEVGAHDTLLDIEPRFKIANDHMRQDFGVPKALLDGESTGQLWAGYEGYRETLRGLQDSWTQALTSLGEKVAERNGFEDVELIYAPHRTILSDQSANADLMLRARKAGISSIRRTVQELGGDYEAERRARIIEMGLDPDDSPESLPSDDTIFSPPLGMPGDTRTDPDGNVIDPGGEPGRPPNSQKEKLTKERAPEVKKPVKK